MKVVKNIVHILRPYHWIKNFFIFLPLVFSNQLFNIEKIFLSTFAFVCFCLVSSSVYIFNDLIDLKADRIHPVKKRRPIASGNVSIELAVFFTVLLSGVGLCVSFFLNPNFALVLLSYFLLNIFYSLYLKHMVILDVMTIGLFFILRVLAGAVIINVDISFWLVICTGLLALFIGFNKRRHELKLLGEDSHHHRKVLERYSVYFIDQMIAVLTASTVIFYTLYTVDDRTVANFATQKLLYTVPFVYYGIFRYLYLVHKRGRGGDPVRIVLTDQKLIINIGLWLAASIFIIYFK